MGYKIVSKSDNKYEYVKTTYGGRYDLTFHFSKNGKGKIYKHFSNAIKASDIINSNGNNVEVIEMI